MVLVIERGMSRQRIRAIIRRAQGSLRRKRKTVDVYKYVGVLSLKEDPVALQRKWRDEW